MKPVLKLLVLAAYMLLAFLSGTHALDQVRYEPAVVILSGTIVREQHFGPPNFGETPDIDMKADVLVLELDSPVEVLSQPSDKLNTDSFGRIGHLQLVGGKGLNLGDRVGQHITLVGTLFEGHSGEHITNVLMDVQKIADP